MSEVEFFFPLNKIVEDGRLVFGRASQEIPDRSGEIADYEETKKAFNTWSSECRKISSGKSLGNLREMHGKNAVGVVQQIHFIDDEKAVDVVAKVVDDQAWAKCLSGVLCGFSIGGSYSRKWKDGEHTRYAPKLSELSLVDRPCVPTATIRDLKKIEIDQVIEKADGTIEQRELVVEEGILEDIAKASDDPDDKNPGSDEDEESEGDGDKDDARKADGRRASPAAGYVSFDQALAKAFDESRHPRGDDGRWARAGAGAGLGALAGAAAAAFPGSRRARAARAALAAGVGAVTGYAGMAAAGRHNEVLGRRIDAHEARYWQDRPEQHKAWQADKADGYVPFDAALPRGYVGFDAALGKAYEESKHKRDKSGRWATYAGTGAAVGAVALPAINAADALRHHYMKAPSLAGARTIGALEGIDRAAMAYDPAGAMRAAGVYSSRAAGDWKKTLGRGQKLALGQYQEAHGHANVSAMLRGDSAGRTRFKALIEGSRHLNPIYGRSIISSMDRALAGARLGQDTTVYRGLTGRFADHLASLKPGSVVHDEGFLSTTASRQVAEGFSRGGYDDAAFGTRWQKPAQAGTVLELNVPKGFNAAPISNNKFLAQNEVALPRGTKYAIDEVVHEGGQRIVRASVLPESGKLFSRSYALRGLGRGTIGTAVGGALAGAYGGTLYNSIGNMAQQVRDGLKARKADGYVGFDAALGKAYDESKHPRSKDGRFSDGRKMAIVGGAVGGAVAGNIAGYYAGDAAARRWGDSLGRRIIGMRDPAALSAYDEALRLRAEVGEHRVAAGVAAQRAEQLKVAARKAPSFDQRRALNGQAGGLQDRARAELAQIQAKTERFRALPRHLLERVWRAKFNARVGLTFGPMLGASIGGAAAAGAAVDYLGSRQAGKADGYVAFDEALPRGYVGFDAALGKTCEHRRRRLGNSPNKADGYQAFDEILAKAVDHA